MSWLASLTFATPLALAALALLPVIWWLLRFTPPRPETVSFPPLRLLLELANREEEPDKTPWWLMLLRLSLLALLILGVAHPSIAPVNGSANSSTPLLLVVDDGWATAETWPRRQAVLREIVAEARNAGAVISIATTTPLIRPPSLEPMDGQAAEAKLAALTSRPFTPDRPGTLKALTTAFANAAALRVIWLTDGLDSASATPFAEGLGKLAGGKASVEAILPDAASLPLALAAPVLDGSAIKVTALRPPAVSPRDVKAVATATNGRSLGTIDLHFATNASDATAKLDLPVELRNDMARLQLVDSRNAAAVFVMDDRWRRKTVALQSGAQSENAQPLLAPLYYVSRAFEPFAALSEPASPQALKDALSAGLSMLVLADIGTLPEESRKAVEDWLAKGGVLVRFAGPRLAGIPGEAQNDPLLPVTLRQGGRDLGSALSWETPQGLQAFPDNSPFNGLAIDPEVKVSRQVLAEPDADLPSRVWASLADGTPLVTARHEGKGLIVLVHVTANADWSNLPLSGLFVDMLRRLLDLAPAAGSATAGTPLQTAADAAFIPRRTLAGDGSMIDPPAEAAPIPAAQIDKATVTADHPPGLYARGGQERALNLSPTAASLLPITALPAGIVLRDLQPQPSQPLAPWLFSAAAILFLLDMLAALFMGGGVSRWRRGATPASLILAVMLLHPPQAHAQSADDFALQNALETHFAYVETGDAEIDRISAEGLHGLTAILRDRTSIEAAEPTAVNIERDEIVFFPLLYWPIRPDLTLPSEAALTKIATYMRNGGTIFFDLREDTANADMMAGGQSAAADALRRLLAGLDIPPLEPVPKDHVLTRSFYLMQDFPGRYDSGRLWVEQMDSEGSGLGNVDGVSTIIIGSNDYAAAWAIDGDGAPLYATIPGGDRQRELAWRSGINIVMYAMTGNYKADQVHVPALLERLGQ